MTSLDTLGPMQLFSTGWHGDTGSWPNQLNRGMNTARAETLYATRSRSQHRIRFQPSDDLLSIKEKPIPDELG